MEPSLNKEEKKLLSAKTPAEFIDISIKCKIPSGRKAYVAKFWIKKTGYTSKDLEYHRNRHPFWKKKKGQGSAERVRKRLEEHNYGDGQKIEWDDELLKQFIEANKKDKNGRYITKDFEMAQQFECTIATIQHLRRKTNMTMKIFAANNEKLTSKRLIEHLQMGEGSLRQTVHKLKKGKR